jgi:hypothetical protein
MELAMSSHRVWKSPVSVAARKFAGHTGHGHVLTENCDLEELAAVGSQRRRWDVCFVVVPLQLRGGTASPVNPIAIF